MNYVATEEVLSSSLSVDGEISLYVQYMTDSLNSQRLVVVLSPSLMLVCVVGVLSPLGAVNSVGN